MRENDISSKNALDQVKVLINNNIEEKKYADIFFPQTKKKIEDKKIEKIDLDNYLGSSNAIGKKINE